jgi:acetoin utilization deacetylase AcuC-like enzyme
MPERIAVVDDSRFEEHRSRGPHPERPERLPAVRRGVERALSETSRITVPTREATGEEIVRVHTPAYLRGLEAALGRGWGQLDADTYFSPGSREAAWLAAGGTVDMARALLDGTCRRGFALVRPPGHHAEPGSAMGFCLLNNVALGAAAALAEGARRVAIVDFDVHHGNGTQAAFEADPRVLFVSLHQQPLYPGTGSLQERGRGEGSGTVINVPLPGGSGPAAYGEAFRRIVEPALERFGADLLLVSAGFDGHEADPLAGMALDAASYGAMTSSLVRQAEAAGHGRVGVVLEGGYDLSALEQSAEAVTRALAGHERELPSGSLSASEAEALERTVEAFGGSA